MKKLLCEGLIGIAMFLILLAIFLLMLHLRAYAAEPEVAVPVHEYSEVFAFASDEDYEALQQVVYWESAVADCKYSVNKAVVETVCNRVLDPEWPNTIYQVCHQRHQFYCKPIPKTVSEYQMEMICDAISETVNGGREVLPGTDYQYFATKRQSCAKDHIWIGDVKADGSPKKGKGMWFARKKGGN